MDLFIIFATSLLSVLIIENTIDDFERFFVTVTTVSLLRLFINDIITPICYIPFLFCSFLQLLIFISHLLFFIWLTSTTYRDIKNLLDI